MKTKKTTSKYSRLNKVIHGITCHLTALSILYTPVTFAQSGFMETASGLIGGVGQFAQQMMAQQQAMQQQEQTAQMMAKFNPNNQMVPSKLFPNCMVLMARSDFPSGACENVPVLGDEAELYQSMAFRNIAEDFDNHIANLLTENQNSPEPVGLQCIKESASKVGQEIENRIKALEAQITFVRKNTHMFEDRNRKITEQMDVLKGDLYGDGSDVNKKSQDFLKNFSPACSTWFGVDANSEARESGLSGLETLSSKINETASNTIANESKMVGDIVNQLDGLDERIKSQGIASFSDLETIKTALGMGGSGQSYSVLDTLIKDKTNLLRSDIEAITSDMKEVGFDIELKDFDRNFKSRFVDFSKNAATYFKKKAVDDCVTGRDASLALGLSTQQILDGLKIREVNSNQTTLTSYKDKLMSILESNAFIDKKLQLIEDLDQEFGVGEIYLTYTDSSGRRTSATTYGLYKDQIAACETKITNTKGFGLDKSYQEKINRANQALQKAIALEKSFRNDLKQSLYDRVVTCKGIEPQQESCSYGSASPSMNVGESNFCISNAVSCAKQVNTCQAEVHTVVVRKQTEMQSLASQFNANVSGLVAQQEALLNQIKTQVLADAEYLNKYFQDSDYVYPEGLFIEMPLEEMHEGYGVALRAKGDLSIVRALPAQLDKLKQTLMDQKTRVRESIIAYTENQSDGMHNEKERWSTLAKRCANVEQGYNQALTEQQNAMKEQQAATGDFCRKYDRIRRNPAGGCGQATSLAESASNISQAVDPYAVDLAQEFADYCSSSQNEREAGTEGGSNRAPASASRTPTAKLISACRSESWDGSKVIERLQKTGHSLKQSEIDDMVGRFDPTEYAEFTGVKAEAYCKSFGKIYTAGAEGEAGTCESASGTNPQPDVCSYFQYHAYRLQEGDNSDVALNEFYETVVAGNSQMEEDEFVKPVSFLYKDYSATTSRSGSIGEQMNNTPCLAVNTNGVGETQSQDSTASRVNDIYNVIGQ